MPETPRPSVNRRRTGAGAPPSTNQLAGRAVGAQVAVVRPLRHLVLRPGRPAGESVYPGDDDPRTTHVAVRTPAGVVLSVGSLLLEDPPWRVEQPGVGWRVRGMATRPQWRDRGYGRVVLDELLRRAGTGGAALVWCNARLAAVTFYLRAGFERVGEPFDVPIIGPHQAMQRLVAKH